MVRVLNHEFNVSDRKAFAIVRYNMHFLVVVKSFPLGIVWVVY